MSNMFEYAAISTRYYQLIIDMFGVNPDEIFDKNFRAKSFTFRCDIRGYPILTVTGHLNDNLDHSYVIELKNEPVPTCTREECILTPRIIQF